MRPTIIILLFTVLLASCHTTRKASDHTAETSTDSSKYWHDQYDAEAQANDVLAKELSKTQYADISFQKQPCPDKSGDTVPENKISVQPDGSVLISGHIATARILNKKDEKQNQAHSSSSATSSSTDRKEYYITKTIEHWHTEIKKIRPAWWWVLVYMVAGGIITWFLKPYLQKLFSFIK